MLLLYIFPTEWIRFFFGLYCMRVWKWKRSLNSNMLRLTHASFKSWKLETQPERMNDYDEMWWYLDINNKTFNILLNELNSALFSWASVFFLSCIHFHSLSFALRLAAFDCTSFFIVEQQILFRGLSSLVIQLRQFSACFSPNNPF